MSPPSPTPWIIAHRANGFGQRENTLAAFSAVPRELGVELDVWMTRDHVPVVHHDAHVRLADGTRHRITAVARTHLPDDVPTLAAALEALSGVQWINIEIKTTRATLTRLLDQLIRLDVCISSFSAHLLRQVRTAIPNADLALLAPPHAGPVAALRPARELGCTGLHIARTQLSPAWIRLIHEHGLALRVYTVNDVQGWALCRHLGVAGVFTDRPLAALDWLRGQSPGQ